jgi:class 3 adenylate cyclase
LNSIHNVTNDGDAVINFSSPRRTKIRSRATRRKYNVVENLVDSSEPRVKNRSLPKASGRRPRRYLFDTVLAGMPARASHPLSIQNRGGLSVKEFHYRWEYDLRASPQALWPLIADTNRFNRDAGVPFVVEQPAEGEAGKGLRRRLRLSKLGVKVEWEEEPFEWIRPFRFGVVRHFKTGPVAEARITAELSEREGGGTHLVYNVWARPRGALGRAVIPLQVGRLSARKFAAVFRRYDALALRNEQQAGVARPAKLGANERTLLASLRQRLIEMGASASLLAQLVETIEDGDDLTLARLRPYALADAWGVERRDTLELCLKATRAGLLDLRWELLCPLCRGAKQSASTLSDVRADLHCDTCNIDFTVNFDRSVEVVFRPNASVRRVEAREFCVGGPQVTPHIVVQQLVGPGERRVVTPLLETGRHRLRTQTLPGVRSVLVSAEGEAELTLSARGAGWTDDEPRVSTRPTLTLENATGEEQLFIFERTAWGDQAATAAEVTALQLFRDLFASEALRPGDQISVGQMTILFTDLRNSTRLYREIGDAVAFGAVMSHFDLLRDAIAAEGGSIVKTLGDAVMAVFPRPAPALRAIISAQAALAAPPASVRPLTLKAGIHAGPCIAVTLNERLDYFGSNVNIAARLEPLSTGEDCVVTSDVRRDPEVAALLEDPLSGLAAEPVEVQLKGFDNECFQLWRVTRKGTQA